MAEINELPIQELEINKFRLPKFHFYPATMTQHLSSFVIKKFSQSGDYVLDPFCGTANILRIARVFNRNGVGVDINPLATLIAKVSLSDYNQRKLEQYLQKIIDLTSFVEFDRLFAKENGLLYWFDVETLDTIESLKSTILSISDTSIRNFFKVTLSSTIRSISKADPNVAPPVFSKHMKAKYRPLSRELILEKFTKRANNNIVKSQINKEMYQPDSTVEIHNADSLKFLQRKGTKFDLIFTSPPYAAAQKYVRSTSLELMTVFNLNRRKLLELDSMDLGSEAVRNYDRIYAKKIQKFFK